MTIEIDRSRVLAYQSCPRSRWLGFHACGKGLQRKQKALPLLFGSAFHEAAEELLHGDVETAVYRALHFLKTEFDSRSVDIAAEGDAQFEYSKGEQAALAEGLIRGWYLHDYPTFSRDFEVIEVEREGRAELKVEKKDDAIVLMFRPDALVRDKLSGDLYVVSWKTTSMFNKRTTDSARHDMQSMSEVWGVQNTHGPNQSHDYDENLNVIVPEQYKVEGVLYKWIVKGKRDKDEWDQLYKQNSPLIYGWKRVGNSSLIEGEDWCHSYRWPKEDGSGQGSLGKGWKKVPIWREYEGGVKQWVEDLAAQRIWPRHINALDEIFPESLPVERRADEVESWRRQVVAQEAWVAEAVSRMENNLQANTLDRYFPQHSHSCHSYSGCQFIDICWGGVDPSPGDLYTIRQSNHPESGDDAE